MASIPLLTDVEAGVLPTAAPPPYPGTGVPPAPSKSTQPLSAPSKQTSNRHAPKRGLFFDDVDDFLHGSSVAAAHVSIRMGFLRKVLGILSAQLLVTVLIGTIFVLTPEVKGFLANWTAIPIAAMIGSFGVLIALIFKRKEAPTNYILLAIWTVCQGVIVGMVASVYERSVVVQAVFLTAAVVVALAIYAMQTSRDFTASGAGLFALLWILVIASMMQLVLMNETFDLLLACGGAVLFSLFIIFDIQMLMHRLSPEEYILATINLYLDIINLFLHILRIVAEANRR